MKFNGRSVASFGARRKLTWGVAQRARSARPIAGSPFFRPTPATPTASTTMSAVQPTTRRAA